MLTSRELARRLGVSQSTISRALNDSPLVPLKKRQFIKDKAAEYGFVLNSQAQSLKTNRTGTIGILMAAHFTGMNINLTLAHLYDCIQRELFHYGYDVMVLYDFGDGDGLPVLVKAIRKQKVDGCIILRSNLTALEKEVIAEYKIPYIYLLHAFITDASSNYCLADSEYGGYLAGKYLGRFLDYKMVCIDNPDVSTESRTRIAGFCRGLREEGYDADSVEIYQCKLSAQSVYECIAQKRKDLMREKTAIFAHNDLMAIGVVNACKDIGLQIPEHIQVIGMDNTPIDFWMTPKLTTVDIKSEEIASIGCELLCNSIENFSDSALQKTIKPELILRETTL